MKGRVADQHARVNIPCSLPPRSTCRAGEVKGRAADPSANLCHLLCATCRGALCRSTAVWLWCRWQYGRGGLLGWGRSKRRPLSWALGWRQAVGHDPVGQ